MCPRVFVSAVPALLFCACAEDAAPSAPKNADDALLPCEVSALLQAHCVPCHGPTPREGAPLTLVRASDFRKPYRGKRVGDFAVMRMADRTRPMPPMSEPPLPREARETLSEWIERGAPADADGCEVHALDAGEGTDAATRSEPDSGTAVRGELERTDWASFGGDLASTRANLRDRAIAGDNVGSLDRVWQVELGSTSSTPAVFDEIAYVPSWDATVNAIGVRDGSRLWATTMPALIDSSAAVSDDRVFVSDAKGSVHALERASGALRWSQKIDEHPEVHLWSSPIYIADAGLVVVGVSSYEEVVGKAEDELTFRGSLVALDAEDGQERWRVWTTAANGDEGAGVAIWSTVAVDVERKVLYVGTGNNYAAPGSALSDAMLAIDYVSGELVWTHQFLADDVFSIANAPGPDFDIGAAANLFTAGGRDLVGVGIKSGLYAALDREDGALVWSFQVSAGGLFGGIIGAPAYADGAVYVLSNDAAAGEVAAAALDAESGEPIWQRTLPGQTFSGVAYANGLVYVGTSSGELAALDARTGQTRWSDVLPDAVASPVIASGTLLVTWGYPITLGVAGGEAGEGGLIAYAATLESAR